MIEIEVPVTVETVTKVSVGIEEIVAALPSSGDELDSEGLPSKFYIATGITNCYTFLAALEPKHIKMLSPQARKLAAEWFREIADKFEAVAWEGDS